MLETFIKMSKRPSTLYLRDQVLSDTCRVSNPFHDSCTDINMSKFSEGDFCEAVSWPSRILLT